MKDKEIYLSNLTVKVPKNLNKEFRVAIANSEQFENVNEAISLYMIKIIGEYNRSLREASRNI